MQPHQVIKLCVHAQFVLQNPAALLCGRRRHRRRLVQFRREVIRLLLSPTYAVPRRYGYDFALAGSKSGIRLPGAAKHVGVVGEARPPLVGAAGESPVVDKHRTVVGDCGGVVGGRIGCEELDGGDHRRVRGEAVEAN